MSRRKSIARCPARSAYGERCARDEAHEPHPCLFPAPGFEALPAHRRSVGYELAFGGLKAHVALGLYHDGRVGELRVAAAKLGSPLRCGLAVWSDAVSAALQHGTPLSEVLAGARGTGGAAGQIHAPGLVVHGRAAGSIYDAIAQLVCAEAPEGVLSEDVRG